VSGETRGGRCEKAGRKQRLTGVLLSLLLVLDLLGYEWGRD